MNDTKQKIAALLMAIIVLAPTTGLAEEGLWDKAKETASKGWEAGKKGAKEAAEWGDKKTAKVLEATKEGAAEAAEWARKKSDKALDAIKGKKETSDREKAEDGREI